MAESQQFVALVGSLRRASLNRAVFDAALPLLPASASMTEFDLRPIPFYDGDVEQESGFPPTVTDLRRAVMEADGLIIFTPEYNHSVPALVKNAIDWLSRVPGDSALTQAAVGVVAATPGRGGGQRVRNHLSDVFGVIAGRFHPRTLGIPSAGHKVEDGRLTDPDALAELESWLAGFAAHCAADPAPTPTD